MKVFTSPVLTADQHRVWLVEPGQFIVLGLKCIQKHVNVPVARFYEIQVSRQQWADESGVKIRLRRDVWNGWEFRHPTIPWEAFRAGPQHFLTKCFGRPTRIFNAYWRLRYWD